MATGVRDIRLIYYDEDRVDQAVRDRNGMRPNGFLALHGPRMRWSSLYKARS